MSEGEAGGRVFFSNVRRSLEFEDEITLVSVGVDIGSSTSHLVFSRLRLERLDSRYVVAEREVVHESEVLLTPYADDQTIDADALRRRAREHFTSEVQAFVRPEFFNRIDRIVVFRPLSRDVLRDILHKELRDVFRRRGLRNRDWAVMWDESAIDFLLDRDSGQNGEKLYLNITVNSVNDLPTITSIADQTIAEDTDPGDLSFTINDIDNPLTDLEPITLIANSPTVLVVPPSFPANNLQEFITLMKARCRHPSRNTSP